MTDTLNIKEWADNKYKEQVEIVKHYIENGMSSAEAVKTVLVGSTLGAGYKAQLRRDFNLSMQISRDGEFQNSSFKIIDTTKTKIKIIRFTPTNHHERNFWLAVLEPIEGIDTLKEAIATKCMDEILSTAKKLMRKPSVLKSYETASKNFLPAVKQAIEIMLGDKE